MNDEPKQAGEATPQGSVEPTPGELLAARRREMRLTVEQAASQLNLAPRQIQAIEENNFAALPGLASTRGFVRSYARLLKMDAEPLLARIAKEASPVEESIPLRRPLPSRPFVEARLTDVRPYSLKRGLFWVALCVVVVAIAAAAVVASRPGFLSGLPAPFGRTIEKPISEKTVVMPPAVGGQNSAAAAHPSAAALSSSEGVGGTDSSANVSGVGSVSPSQVGGASAPATSGAPPSDLASSRVTADQVSAPLAVTNSAHDAAVRPASAKEASALDHTASALPVERSANPPAGKLVFSLTENSWIQVRQADGKVLAAGVFKAGSTETIPVNGPASIVVGNVKGTKAEYNGQQVNLAVNAVNNVARLTLK